LIDSARHVEQLQGSHFCTNFHLPRQTGSSADPNLFDCPDPEKRYKIKKIQNQYFIITFSPGRFKRTRLGITVSKKVGNAVTRNRIKRFAREYFRRNRQDIAGHWDVHLIAKKEAAGLCSKETFTALTDIFKRIQLF
jgi:ribonuclease P protein component